MFYKTTLYFKLRAFVLKAQKKKQGATGQNKARFINLV